MLIYANYQENDGVDLFIYLHQKKRIRYLDIWKK